MGHNINFHDYFYAFLFSLTLIIPSIGCIQHSPLGNNAVVAYCFIALISLFFIYLKFRYIFQSSLNDKQSNVISLVAIIIIFIIAAIGMMLVKKGVIPGGNVRDNTLEIAIAELLNGRYPYYVAVSLAEPITLLPGSLLLGMPFVFIGFTGFQNLFWLAIFFILIAKYFGNKKFFLSFILTIFLFTPVLIHELISGSDLLSNSIWIFLITIGVFYYTDLSGWQRISLAIFSGIAFSSRFNFLLLTPFLFLTLSQRSNLKEALKYSITTIIVFTTLTAPFYLYDPNGFSPIHVKRFVNVFNDIIPHYGSFLLLATIVLIVLLSLRKINKCSILLANCAIILAVPNISAIVLNLFLLRTFEVGPFSNFCLSFYFFAAVTLWQHIPNNKQLSIIK